MIMFCMMFCLHLSPFFFVKLFLNSFGTLKLILCFGLIYSFVTMHPYMLHPLQKNKHLVVCLV